MLVKQYKSTPKAINALYEASKYVRFVSALLTMRRLKRCPGCQLQTSEAESVFVKKTKPGLSSYVDDPKKAVTCSRSAAAVDDGLKCGHKKEGP